MLLAAADCEQFVQVFQLDHPTRAIVITLSALFKTCDRSFRHQTVAVDAYEARGKFFFQFGERFFEQIFAFNGAHRDVFQFGAQVQHEFDGYQLDFAAFVDGKIFARFEG